MSARRWLVTGAFPRSAAISTDQVNEQRRAMECVEVELTWPGSRNEPPECMRRRDAHTPPHIITAGPLFPSALQGEAAVPHLVTVLITYT